VKSSINASCIAKTPYTAAGQLAGGEYIDPSAYEIPVKPRASVDAQGFSLHRAPYLSYCGWRQI
jgi:hypothetical protein